MLGDAASMRTFPWRRLSGTAVLALTATMLSGCSPAPEPMVALSMANGKPVAIFVACNSSLAILHVYENDPARRPAGGSSSEATAPIWTVRSQAPQLVTEVTLFEAPPGWEVTESTLTGLDPGVHYSAGGVSLRHAVQVDFTTSDLEALGPDQVFSADRRHTGALARTAFESAAKNLCPH